MDILREELSRALGVLESLQRPFYWSWGIGHVNSTGKWPRREDKLKRADTKSKEGFRRVKGGGGSAFTDDSVRTTTRYLVECNSSSCTDASSSWVGLTSSFSSSVVTSRTSEVIGLRSNSSVILSSEAPFLDAVLAISNNGTNSSWGVDANGTFYDDSFEGDAVTDVAIMVSTAAALALVILATVIGNVFVIAAILLERNLQNVANYLILSLAVADLLVACLVMPLSAVYEVSKQWTLGPELCDMWTSSDVLCCTASILHLVAIALDRYWAVTNIDYIHQRTARRIGLMIMVIWGVAFAVCIAPLLGWKDPEWESRIYVNQTCLVSQDIGYQVFATASSFYVPLLVILILYWRIFQTARKRIRRRGGQGGPATPRNPAAGGVVAGAAGGSGGIAAAVVAVIGRPLPTISETTTAFTTVSSTNTSPEKHPPNGIEPDLPTADCLSSYQQSIPYPIPIRRKPKEVADSKRERKAAKTLAIITGAFVVCWLPFFILAILLPVCKTCEVNEHFVSFFLWLGYLNSTLNPIIYTIFSPEFRHAFKRLLCGRRASIRRRNVRHYGPRHFQ